MIIMKTIYIILFLVLLLSSCKKSQANSSYDEKIIKIQEYYKSKIKESYEIANSSSSREEAVLKLLNDISKGKLDSPYICSEQETKEILLPNTYNTGTITSLQEPEEAWNLMKIRREIGLEQLKKLLFNKKIISVDFKWKTERRDLNSLKGHTPIVFVRTNQGEIQVEEIKLIIEHNGQFKVCIVSK